MPVQLLRPIPSRAEQNVQWRYFHCGCHHVGNILTGCIAESTVVISGCCAVAVTAATLVGHAGQMSVRRHHRDRTARKTCRKHACREDSTILQVPEQARRLGTATPPIDWNTTRETACFANYGLAELFPESVHLAHVFNFNAGFRHDLRVSMRKDLYRPVPGLDREVNEELKDLWMDLNKPHVKAPLAEQPADSDNSQSYRMRPLPCVTASLVAQGVSGLTGETFVERLLRLGEMTGTGRFSDLVGRPHEGYRWHQDHGGDRFTVMLGFPPEDGFEGVGVFSHVVRLSHPLRQPTENNGWTSGTPIAVRFPGPESHILRPQYRPGQEVLVWRDSACLHSTPDVVHREALWRFM